MIVETEDCLKLKVLDKGYVKLLNVSGPTRRRFDLFDANDRDPANCARLSFDQKDTRSYEDDLRLNKYLYKHRHTTPLEMIETWWEVKLPIFVARQLVRHRTACLAQGTKVIFNRPCDGKAYPIEISSLLRKKEDPSQVQRLLNMQVRHMTTDGKLGVTRLKDIWHSGAKRVYSVNLDTGLTVTASADHLFYTTEGWKTVADLNGCYVFATRLSGEAVGPHLPTFTDVELLKEEWREVLNADGYEVSSLGRIRSYWGQGTKGKRSQPSLKTQTISQGRYIVGIHNKPRLVSRMVAAAFLGACPVSHEVLHTDDNEWDNRLSNLRYGTAGDNRKDAKINGGLAILRACPSKVLTINYAGTEDTFDLEVEADEHNFFANNIVTHNSINEVSRRYVDDTPEFYFPPGWRGRSTNKKQGSSDLPFESVRSDESYEHSLDIALHTYNRMLEEGVAPEMARMVLPLSTYTKWIWQQDFHNLMHMLQLRSAPDAQWEAQQYANAQIDLLSKVLPDLMSIVMEKVA